MSSSIAQLQSFAAWRRCRNWTERRFAVAAVVALSWLSHSAAAEDPAPMAHLASSAESMAFTQAGSFSYQTGRALNIFSRTYANGGSLVYVVLEGQRVGAPPCATGNYWMVVDDLSEAGKREVALLMSARMNDVPITIIGRQTCTKWLDGKDIHEIIL